LARGGKGKKLKGKEGGVWEQELHYYKGKGVQIVSHKGPGEAWKGVHRLMGCAGPKLRGSRKVGKEVIKKGELHVTVRKKVILINTVKENRRKKTELGKPVDQGPSRTPKFQKEKGAK